MILANPRFDAPGKAAGEGRSAGDNGQRSTDLARLARAQFTPLPGTAEEAEALRAVLPKPTVRTGTEATKAALRTLHGPAILHIATHGFFLDSRRLRAPLYTDSTAIQAPGLAALLPVGSGA